MSVLSNDFTFLNSLRPGGAFFGEVVQLTLRDRTDNFISRSKRKSIHCPPAANAYWNFVNLRSGVVEWNSITGASRDVRTRRVRLLNLCIRLIHLKTMEACYEDKGIDHQYFEASYQRDEATGLEILQVVSDDSLWGTVIYDHTDVPLLATRYGRMPASQVLGL